jgi:hypothetical protein
MFRKFLLAAAIGALSVPAFAEPAKVTVNVAGMDAKAAHEAIFHAAQVACREALADETDLVKFYVRADCISGAIAAADTKYESMRGLASR